MEEALAGPAATARSVDAGRGSAWWSESWTLFMKNPGMWLVFGIIFLIGFFVLALIPFLGGLVSSLISPVITGGWMMSARKLEGGGPIEAADLFSGFKDKLNPLLVLGALSLAAFIVIAMFGGVLGGGAIIATIIGGGIHSGAGIMTGIGVGLLVFLVCMVLAAVVAMAFWYAPALVVFRNLAPVDAIKASWAASMTNIVPFLIYGLIWIVAAVIASIPFMLGWFVMIPLTMLGMYCSYQDIFERA